MPITIGQVLAGKYRLEASIGRGGMGEVFAASHVAPELHTEARVAVKVVSRELLGDLHMQRLHREAIAAGRIRSELVPQVYEIDRTEDGELFLVMELLHGESLAERLRSGQVLAWEEVRAIGDDLLSGLIDAHTAGVVHRDLKPGNVFLEQRGGRQRARILDFGVCKLDAPDTEKLTTTGEAVGTISYMAPEQIRGASKVDERADLYSFGMVIFEMLSGRLPFDAQGQIAIIASKLERPARPLKELAQVAVPAGLEAVVAKSLARKPDDRFASASEARRAWRALGPATTQPRPSGSLASVASSATPETNARTNETIEKIAYQSRGSRVGLMVAAAALVLASGVLSMALRAGGAAASGAGLASAPAPASAPASASASASTPVSSSSSASSPDPALPTAAAAKAPRASWHAPRPRPPKRAAPSSQAPHMTTEPRY